MTLDLFLERVYARQVICFNDVISTIDHHYDYTPTGFSNGLYGRERRNEAGQNAGSCKVLAFALLFNLDKRQTLHLFAEHYRDVLDHPEADCHPNIRAFIEDGWAGVKFDAQPLLRKSV